MRKLSLFAVLLGLVVCPQVWAQSPELAAHRLYFSALAASLGPNGEETPALEAYLNDAKVTKDEHQKVVTALSIYQKRLSELIDKYNNSPATLAGTNDETTVFLIKRDLVVEITIETLKVALSAHNINELEGRIAFWGEKNHVNDLAESSELSDRHPHLMPVQQNMGPHYNYYHVSGVSANSDGSMWAYSTAELQGYANCGGCFVYHTGKVYNSMGGGGWIWGPSVTPPTYMNVQNPQSFFFNAGCFNDTGSSCNSESWEEMSEVNCSSGWTWGSTSFKWTVEAAVTFSQVTGWQNGSTAVLQEWCLAQYIPPDYNPTFLLNAQQGATYVLGGALCFDSTWSSGFWLCSPGIATSLTGTYTRKYCTHNIPPY